MTESSHPSSGSPPWPANPAGVTEGTALARPGTSAAAPREPVEAEPPAGLVVGDTGSADDRFAARVVSGVETYWRRSFPDLFEQPWQDIQGFMAVDPDETGTTPPCMRRSLDLTNQALYCPRLDTVAWDRTRLLPRLRAEYGDGAVVVALAHEIGHAVQDRLGIDVTAQTHDPGRYPTILLEGMADCYAGATLRAVADGEIPTLSTSPGDLNGAMAALLSFRDPVGRPTEHGAHGTGFDRASAFLRGFDRGPRQCAVMTLRHVTAVPRPELELVEAGRARVSGALAHRVGADARGWFGRLAADRGERAMGRTLLTGAGCLTAAVIGQGRARSCPGDLAADDSPARLAPVRARFGDYAAASVLASRYALATLGTLGHPVHGPGAGRAAVCLAGAYTRDLLNRPRGFGLPAGGLDEAVDQLMAEDTAARDADGVAPEGDLGFDRVRQYRVGVLGGASACGV